ncbi:f-box domain-containing protein [Gigaspora margarita]|uniref:F-box domain-containing protein n=1 Tax=Gigaspora margarita TaxID=4874 RepID=A0A8H4AL14_GIGMA|nr:f-box domain-containing protein [Gigaspora margarita]
MLNLPNECLFEILNNFKSYNNVDYRSLFSCLLVNRQWCRSAIPILWSKIEISNNGKLIRICLSELNTEEKALLIPFRIFLPNNPKPLFEYLAYTTDLIIDTTYGIQEWLCDSIVLDPIFSFSTQNAVDAVGDSLIRLFLRTSKKLKYLTFLSGYLLYNPLGLEGIQVLAKALDKDTTLTSLTLGYIPISSKAKKALAEIQFRDYLEGIEGSTRLSSITIELIIFILSKLNFFFVNNTLTSNYKNKVNCGNSGNYMKNG